MQNLKNLIRLVAIGYLWDQTDGKVTHDALRSFSAGAAWAVDFLAGQGDLSGSDKAEEANEKNPIQRVSEN